MNSSQLHLLASLIEPFYSPATNIPILLTSSFADANAWAQTEIIDKNVSILGIDAEWKPVEKGITPLIAVLQVATIDSVLVFQIIHATDPMDEGAFFDVLQDSSIFKVSVEILHDSLLVSQQYGIDICGRIDLGSMDTDDLLGYRRGLKHMSEAYLGTALPKPKKIQTSEWDEIELSSGQISYAALDAWICLPLFAEIRKTREFVVDELTPAEGLVKWNKWKANEKSRRKWLKKRDAMPFHDTFKIPDEIIGTARWKEFHEKYATRRSRLSSALGGILEVNEMMLSVHAKEKNVAEKVEHQLENLRLLIVHEEENGGELPFQIEHRKRGRLFVLDYKGTREVKPPYSKSQKFNLHIKLKLFRSWFDRRVKACARNFCEGGQEHLITTSKKQTNDGGGTKDEEVEEVAQLLEAVQI